MASQKRYRIVRVDKGDGSEEVVQPARLLELGYTQGEVDGVISGKYGALETSFAIYKGVEVVS